ncbi:hypothetical protein [Methylobacterium sp. OT2]|uniref:hypothetical protein n=1 Tax=Methylobacterium sp. OT2 TaxID=2813779 RepID=UPI00197B4D33|nr:hypothetical protein [Methylobacterium sp. OT2]MBN4098615.1 hypothetical protein [Methylobacterium sp. OT2]
MTEKKPAQPVTSRHVIGDSIYPPFPVKAPLPTGTAAPAGKTSAAQTTATGSSSTSSKTKG